MCGVYQKMIVDETAGFVAYCDNCETRFPINPQYYRAQLEHKLWAAGWLVYPDATVECPNCI